MLNFRFSALHIIEVIEMNRSENYLFLRTDNRFTCGHLSRHCRIGIAMVLLFVLQSFAQPFPKSPHPWRAEYDISLESFEFSHPMTVLNQTELRTVRQHIQNDIEPQSSTFDLMLSAAKPFLTFEPDAPVTMDIMGGYEPNSNLGEMRDWLWRNSHAAYTCALAYALTDESKYAEKAREVIMDWVNTCTTFTGGDRGLQLGSWFTPLLVAADLIWDYSGFTLTDKQQLRDWVSIKWLDQGDVLDVMRRKDNNWKDAALKGVFTAAVILEDKELLQEAIVQLMSFFYSRTDAYVDIPGPGWKITKDDRGVYLPREVVRNDGRSGITYTAYALTTMVQNLEMARYAGFDFWHKETEQGATIKEVIEQYFRWNSLRERFPWNPGAKRTVKRLNSYELANTHYQVDEKMKTWIENLRPLSGREGDAWITLTKGDLPLTPFGRIMSPVDGAGFLRTDTLLIDIFANNPVDTVELFIDDSLATRVIHTEHNRFDTPLLLENLSSGDHSLLARIVDELHNVFIDSVSFHVGSAYYSITDLTDPGLGRIAMNPPGGTYLDGTVVSLTAIPKPGYEFIHWAGDVNSWADTLTVVINSNLSLKTHYHWFMQKLQSFALQAEDQTLGGGATVDQSHEGFNGSGFVSFPANGGQVIFENIRGGNGGSARFTVRWANGDTDRTGHLVVNQDTLNITMEATGGWDVWKTQEIPIMLNPDSLNVISLLSIGQGFGFLDEITLTLSTLVGVKTPEIDGSARKFALAQNYPNPFNPVTQIAFDLSSGQQTSLKIYNTRGQMVREVVNEMMDPGHHIIDFDARDLPSGVYFYRLESGSFSKVRRMVLLQ